MESTSSSFAVVWRLKVSALVVLCTAGAHAMVSKMALHRRATGVPGVVAWSQLALCAVAMPLARLAGALASTTPLCVRADWQPRQLLRAALPFAARVYCEMRVLQLTSIDTFFVLRALLLPALLIEEAMRVGPRAACRSRRAGARDAAAQAALAPAGRPCAAARALLAAPLAALLVVGGTLAYVFTVHPLGADFYFY